VSRLNRPSLAFHGAIVGIRSMLVRCRVAARGGLVALVGFVVLSSWCADQLASCDTLGYRSPSIVDNFYLVLSLGCGVGACILLWRESRLVADVLPGKQTPWVEPAFAGWVSLLLFVILSVLRPQQFGTGFFSSCGHSRWPSAVSNYYLILVALGAGACYQLWHEFCWSDAYVVEEQPALASFEKSDGCLPRPSEGVSFHDCRQFAAGSASSSMASPKDADRAAEHEEFDCPVPSEDHHLDTPVPQEPKARALHATRAGRAGGLPVLLHIYDVSQDSRVQGLNSLFAHRFSPLKSGIFHAGVEVAGREYSFGYCAQGSGVGISKPKGHPSHHYRETCHLSRTTLSEADIIRLLQGMASEYPGSAYHVVRRNCCTFSDDFCQRLGVGRVPPWVHRLARLGDAVLCPLEGLEKRVGALRLSRAVASGASPVELLVGQFRSLQVPEVAGTAETVSC